jgi:hypothetical protein
MPNTLIPIQTVTVGSGGASTITFTNIPQNYTDLYILWSVRTDRPSSATDAPWIRFNSSATSPTNRRVFATGSGIGTNTDSWMTVNAAESTANIFSNVSIYIPNYSGSTNKSFSIESVLENNATEGYPMLQTGIWSSTAAITSIELNLAITARSFVQNTTATLYGVSNGVKATGGTLTVAGGYAIHTFTSTGSFLPTQQIKDVDFLVVAGGGGGGQNNSGAGSGGGGAGGYRTSAGTSGANSGAESKLNLIAGNPYTVIVGAGGAGRAIGDNTNGGNGTNSIFNVITSTGGGGGAGANSNSASVGNAGGSGGGGNASTVSSTGGAGTANQGLAGGIGGVASGTDYSGGGGGGAGAVGGNKADLLGGAGGAGLSSFITGTTTFYAGGGGGATYGASYAAGGVGGGGAGAPSSGSPAGIAGTVNTGGGGGGVYGGGNSSGAGGSGIVIIRYRLD